MTINEAVHKYLNDHGYLMSVANIHTVAKIFGTLTGAESYINGCRDIPEDTGAVIGYKIAYRASDDAVAVFVDYSYENAWNKLLEYATTLLNIEVSSLRGIATGSLEIEYEDNVITLKYDAKDPMMFDTIKKSKPLPDASQNILDQAHKWLPAFLRE